MKVLYCNQCGTKTFKRTKFCPSCGTQLTAKLVHWKKIIGWLALLIFIVFWLYAIYSYIISIGDRESDIISSVVNVLCPSSDQEFSLENEMMGGSGTIIDSEGIVITNSHIIPQSDDFLDVHEKGCFIILPEPTTGFSTEVYIGTPMVMPGLSDNYDLAFIEIYDVYTDPSNSSVYGSYPKNFPAFDDAEYCTSEYIKLGEPIKIYGYPITSGGYNLTITEGLVSSFQEEGLIMTSAKIDEGSSGGLAVDKNGCMIGIPTMINIGKFENFGVIISTDLINEFATKILELITPESRDARRISDIKQILTAVELYYLDKNEYPASSTRDIEGLCLTDNGFEEVCSGEIVYMQNIPVAPFSLDSECTEEDDFYYYERLTPDNYKLQYCLETNISDEYAGEIPSGINIATPDGLSSQ